MEEKLYFQSKDGLKLCGILSNPEKATNKCIILCHGLTVDKEEKGVFSPLAKLLIKAGFVVFRFDFRAHGESEGKQEEVTVKGMIDDVASAIELLKKKGYAEFGMLAASFSGGPAAFYLAENPAAIKALVLWNALIDYDEKINPTTEHNKKQWGKTHFEIAEKQGFVLHGRTKFKLGRNLMREMKVLEPWKKLEALKIPILFVHGTNDIQVSYSNAKEYAHKWNAQLATIEGAEHGFHNDKKFEVLAEKAAVKFFLENVN